MRYENRKYIIITTKEASSIIDYSKVLETSNSTLRYNNDKTKTIVKFEGDTPDFLEGKTDYTYTEIISIVNDINGEWYSEDD